MELKIKKMRDGAKIPARATEGSAGLDLCAAIPESLTISPGGSAVVPTGIAIALPDSGHVALVFPRSGLAIKHGIGLLNAVGVIDSDYRGEIAVGLVNQFDTPYTIAPDERVAQLVVVPVALPEIIETDDLGDTSRGAGGFGSTGR